MEAKMCWFVLALQTLSFLVSAASRPLATNDGFAASKPGQSIQFAQAPLGSKEGIESMEGGAAGMISDEAYSRGVSKIGSSPPSCEHKCYGCTPCEAIQVPTTNKRRSRLGINYANYEPEGWKCKCGPSFYSP